MGRYSKLIASLAGTAAIGATTFGLLEVDQADALVVLTLSALSTFGVYQLPNKG